MATRYEKEKKKKKKTRKQKQEKIREKNKTKTQNNENHDVGGKKQNTARTKTHDKRLLPCQNMEWHQPPMINDSNILMLLQGTPWGWGRLDVPRGVATR